jgi:hypothetical protein
VKWGRFSGNEPVAFGEPLWDHLPEHEVKSLIGRDELQALLPGSEQAG